MKDELHTTWHKSSYSTQEGGQCVELANCDTTVGIRDSTDPLGPMLQIGRDSLAELLSRIKTGDLDR